jgi:hypothetical protein
MRKENEMANTEAKKIRKRPAKSANGKAPSLHVQIQQLERELKDLRDENRQLKRSLGTLMSKDLPVDLTLTPEDGVFKPSLLEIIAKLERGHK